MTAVSVEQLDAPAASLILTAFATRHLLTDTAAMPDPRGQLAYPNDVKSIALDITGDENALESIEVLDASGEKVSNGMSSISFNNGPIQNSLDLEKPLDDSMKLVVKVAVDRKIVSVPFDLKDIALP